MIVVHDSDCAMHNEPAYPNGPCDCSAMTTPEPTVFERCAIAACETDGGRWDDASYPPHIQKAVRDEYYATVRAVLTALRDYTPSPRTVDEVTRVLGEHDGLG